MTWSIVTAEGSYAVRYYAAMCDAAMRIHVTDRLLYAECCWARMISPITI